MTVRASRNIEEGEDITHTYVDPLDPVLIRYTEKKTLKKDLYSLIFIQLAFILFKKNYFAVRFNLYLTFKF